MPIMTLEKMKSEAEQRGFLDGQMLVAMPAMADPRFARSVIYVCAHSQDGAMGIVVNQLARRIKFPELLVQLNVIKREEAIRLPPSAGAIQVLKGGPVEKERGFVLHSSDFFIKDFDLADRRRHLTHAHASTFCGRSPRAAARIGRCSLSAMPAGHLGSSKTRSSRMAGSIVPPTPT